MKLNFYFDGRTNDGHQYLWSVYRGKQFIGRYVCGVGRFWAGGPIQDYHGQGA